MSSASIDIYGPEVTPTKGCHSRGHDRAAMHMFLRFLRFFRRNRDPALSQRDRDRFIRERREPTECRPPNPNESGKPLSRRFLRSPNRRSSAGPS